MINKFQLFGAEVYLDRLTPPEDGIYDYEYLCSPIYEDSQAYACTFTVPNDPNGLFYKDLIDISNGRVIRVNVLRTPNDQIIILRGMITKWIQDFKRNLKKMAPKSCNITGYLITYELTQAGLVHAHGLIFVDNHYWSVVSQCMTQTWINISGGNWKAMQSISIRGGRFKDKAFDKCNCIQSWIQYILKKKPHICSQLYGDHCIYTVKHYHKMIKGIDPSFYFEKDLIF